MYSTHSTTQRRGTRSRPTSKEPAEGWPIKLVSLNACIHRGGEIHWSWHETIPGREWWRTTTEATVDDILTGRSRLAVATSLRDASTVRYQAVSGELEFDNVPW